MASLAAREVRLQLEVPPGATLVPLSAVYPVQQLAVLADLQAYADMLGKERVEAQMHTLRQQLSDLVDSPTASKQAVYASHRAVRKSKNFGS